MDERILEFIGDLRRAELRISPSEALDALAASAEVGLTDRETFKATLAATLVKESRDLATFDRIFNLYFLDLEALGEGIKKALGPEDPRVQELLDRLVDEEGLELDDLTELLMRGEGSEMEMAIRAGGQNAGLERLMYFLQVGYFSRKISDKFDWSAIERDIEKIMRMLEARGLDPGQLARIRNYLELRLEAFNRFAKTELESLDRKTTILILGDARNNYNDPQAWALRLIRERVKGIIWLNPEGQWGWGIGDSVMPLYTPACDFVRECRTIGQLGEVVDNLVHHWWRRGR